MYKHWDDMAPLERAQFLANETVDDLRCTLGSGRYDIDVLRKARRMVSRRGEKTKTKMLASKINQQQQREMTTFHFVPEALHLLTWFSDSPDTGDPACICSLCGKLIEEGIIPLRIFDERRDKELRLHMNCASQVIEGFGGKQ